MAGCQLSYAAIILKPARWKPNDRPPQPQNKSTTVNILLLMFTLTPSSMALLHHLYYCRIVTSCVNPRFLDYTILSPYCPYYYIMDIHCNDIPYCPIIRTSICINQIYITNQNNVFFFERLPASLRKTVFGEKVVGDVFVPQ